MNDGKAKRSCGGCTQCCKTMEVAEGVKVTNTETGVAVEDTVTFFKPQNEWCKHCDKGRGCKVYERRPQACANFNCLWAQGIGDDSLRPDRTKVVMTCTNDGHDLVLHVDPSRPDAYKTPVFNRIIDGFIEGGKHRVFVVLGDQRRMIENRKVAR